MFIGCTSLYNVTIENGVTSIGAGTFQGCTSLTNVTIPLSVTSIETHTFGGCTSLTNITFPISISSIQDAAFNGCSSLKSITVPPGVYSIGAWAFARCAKLTGVYFEGNAPYVGSNVFEDGNNATIYFLSGTTGWGPIYADRPTALWLPQVQTSEASFGVRTNQFGFTIAWVSGRYVVVEACTDLANPVWSAVSTNAVTANVSYFRDSEWADYASRFYRLRPQ